MNTFEVHWNSGVGRSYIHSIRETRELAEQDQVKILAIKPDYKVTIIEVPEYATTLTPIFPVFDDATP